MLNPGSRSRSESELNDLFNVRKHADCPITPNEGAGISKRVHGYHVITRTQTRARTHTRTQIHTNAQGQTHGHTRVSARTHTHSCIHTHKHTRGFTHMDSCELTHTHTHTHTHTQTQTNTHTRCLSDLVLRPSDTALSLLTCSAHYIK